MTYKSQIKRIINGLFNHFDISIERKSFIDRLKENTQLIRNFGLLKYLDENESILLIKNLSKSKAQLKQDLFVLSQLKFKENGFFVEFGATKPFQILTYLKKNLIGKGY